MDLDTAGPSNCDSIDIMDVLCEGPVTVLDQAIEEAEKYPERSSLLFGRMFGDTSNKLRPCKACCGITTKNETTNGTSTKYTAEEIENMTDLCSAHYQDCLLKQREKAKAILEAKLAKKARKEQAKLAKRAEKLKKKMKGKAEKPEKRKYKKRATTKTKPEPPKLEVHEEDIDDYILKQMEPKEKKITRWFCPNCNKSAKFGSCGCVGCGEWYHFTCVGFKKAKEVPAVWTCKYCK